MGFLKNLFKRNKEEETNKVEVQEVVEEKHVFPVDELRNAYASLNERMRSVMAKCDSTGKAANGDRSFDFLPEDRVWDRTAGFADSPDRAYSLAKLYILTQLYPKYVTEEEFNESGEIYERWFDELGFDEIENPFITFLKKKTFSLKEDDAINLNDLYAQDILSYSDIAGRGLDGTNHIIFNEEVYRNADDYNQSYTLIEDYCSFNELIEKNKSIDKKKLKILQDYNLCEDFNNLPEFKNYKQLRNYIFYKDGKLRKPYFILGATRILLD